MQTTVNMPGNLFEKSVAVAASRGATVEQIVVEAVAKELEGYSLSSVPSTCEVNLPVLRSQNPGTLDLSQFNFDDLLT